MFEFFYVVGEFLIEMKKGGELVFKGLEDALQDVNLPDPLG